MKAQKRIFIGTVILLFCVVFNFAKGQESESISSAVDSLYFESPALFTCNLQFPIDYNLDNSIPVVIGLHGGGGSFETFRNIWNHFESPGFILATPQAQYKWLMGDEIGYDWSAWPSGDLLFKQKALKLTSDYIENLVQTLTEKINISEVYLLGFSQGSIIVQIAGINNHDVLKGIIIISGPEMNHPGKPEIVWPSEETVRLANHLNVLIAHGKADEIIDISLARRSREQYKKLGFSVSLFEFEGGHVISAEAMREVEKWIKEQE